MLNVEYYTLVKVANRNYYFLFWLQLFGCLSKDHYSIHITTVTATTTSKQQLTNKAKMKKKKRSKELYSSLILSFSDTQKIEKDGPE